MSGSRRSLSLVSLPNLSCVKLNLWDLGVTYVIKMAVGGGNSAMTSTFHWVFKKLDYFFFTLWRVIVFILVNISHCKNNLPFIVCTRCCFYWIQHISYFQLFAHAQQVVPVRELSLFFLSLSAFLALLIHYCDFGETPPAFSIQWAGSRNHQLLPLPGTAWCHQLLLGCVTIHCWCFGVCGKNVNSAFQMFSEQLESHKWAVCFRNITDLFRRWQWIES